MIKYLIISLIIIKHLIIGLLIFYLVGCGTTISPMPSSNNTKILITPLTYTSNFQWSYIVNTLNTTQSKTIIIYWEGYGGNISVGQYVSNAMDNARSRGVYLVVSVTGYSASMHALNACHGSKLDLNGTLMFHIGAYNGVPDMTSSGRRTIERLMVACVSKGIISSYDIQQVQSGKEVYVHPGGSKTYKPDKRLK